jgi:hypothetical protein
MREQLEQVRRDISGAAPVEELGPAGHDLPASPPTALGAPAPATDAIPASPDRPRHPTVAAAASGPPTEASPLPRPFEDLSTSDRTRGQSQPDERTVLIHATPRDDRKDVDALPPGIQPDRTRWLGPPPVPQQRAIALLQEASDHLDRGNVEAAAERTRQALDLAPDLPEVSALEERVRESATRWYRQRRATTPPPAPDTLRESGRYRELSQLGDGPSGSVYLAWDRHRSRLAALKVIPPGSPLDRDRFERAPYSWLALDEHPNVVDVYDIATHEGSPCIVMEYLPGKTLDKIIAERPHMPLTHKVDVVAQVCDGIAYLHQKNIIHRDIRPSSILVLPDGQVKLLESGIARAALPQDPEITRTLLLINDYRAPEQARGRSEQRSDIFSVGVVLFELLTYRRLPPTRAEDEIRERLSSVRPSIPGDIIAVVSRALKADPVERFASIEDMRHEIAISASKPSRDFCASRHPHPLGVAAGSDRGRRGQ